MSAYAHLDRPTITSYTSTSFAIHNAKWPSPGSGLSAAPVTWSLTVLNGGTPITDTSYIDAIDRAFDMWEAVANIDFTRQSGDADIDLYYNIRGSDGHGSSNGVLATAYWSFTTATVGTINTITNSEIEFDPVDMQSTTAQFFFQVALHEIGHSIGLDHIEDDRQIMDPIISGDLDSLGEGDIAGIQSIYGPPGSNFGDTTNDNIDLSSDTSAAQIFGRGGNDTLRSGSGADTIVGGTGNDLASGGAGRDLLFDAFGDDTLQGGNGEDNLSSLEGKNRFEGGAGNDAIRGGIGDDTLVGGTGDDALIADEQTASSLFFGDDRLVGGTGNDLLEGGLGQDVFVFAANQGSDTIGKIAFNVDTGFSITAGQVDFRVGEDKLDVSAFGFASEGQVLAALSNSAQGAVFDASNTQVTVTGVDVTALSINDFIW